MEFYEVAYTSFPIDVIVPAIKEFSKVVSKINNGKAAGSDAMPAEVLNSNSDVTEKMLHVL